MNKHMNNKGFTLVEVLAVLIILSAIMAIAIPSISSSLERNKDKQDASKKKMIESSAEMYVTDHKSAIYNSIGSTGSCYISISDLELSGEAKKDAAGNELNGYVIFDRSNLSYTYKDDKGALSECYSGQGTSTEENSESGATPEVTTPNCNAIVKKENVSVEFNPPLTACTIGTPYYFGKSYSIDSTNNTFNLVDSIGCGNTSTNFSEEYPYVCSDTKEESPLTEETTNCEAVIKVTGCNGECNGENYIGNLYVVECS